MNSKLEGFLTCKQKDPALRRTPVATSCAHQPYRMRFDRSLTFAMSCTQYVPQDCGCVERCSPAEQSAACDWLNTGQERWCKNVCWLCSQHVCTSCCLLRTAPCIFIAARPQHSLNPPYIDDIVAGDAQSEYYRYIVLHVMHTVQSLATSPW